VYCETTVYVNEIEKYCNEYFFSALQAWYNTKKWGLANGNGWANEPMGYLEAINVLEVENDKMEQEEMDKKSKASKADGKGKKTDLTKKDRAPSYKTVDARV
jgi:hypothetical protein